MSAIHHCYNYLGMLKPETESKSGRRPVPEVRAIMGGERQCWIQGGGLYPPPTKKPQFVKEPLSDPLVQVPLKRYAPVPVLGGFEVFTVPVHVALPAVPLYVVPLAREPDTVPVPFLLSV